METAAAWSGALHELKPANSVIKNISISGRRCFPAAVHVLNGAELTLPSAMECGSFRGSASKPGSSVVSLPRPAFDRSANHQALLGYRLGPACLRFYRPYLQAINEILQELDRLEIPIEPIPLSAGAVATGLHWWHRIRGAEKHVRLPALTARQIGS